MSAEPEPEKRRKRADEVRERLLTLISEQSLKPGDIVPSERELMAEFGVGRPVVREAMQALQALALWKSAMAAGHASRSHRFRICLKSLAHPCATPLPIRTPRLTISRRPARC